MKNAKNKPEMSYPIHITIPVKSNGLLDITGINGVSQQTVILWTEDVAKSLQKELNAVLPIRKKKVSIRDKQLSLAAQAIGRIRDSCNKETDEIINDYFAELDKLSRKAAK